MGFHDALALLQVARRAGRGLAPAAFLAAGLGLAVLAACDKATEPPPGIVHIRGSGADGFDPPTVTVRAGDVVTWTNDDTTSHGVVDDSDLYFGSPLIAPDSSFAFRFTDPGTFGYHCSRHPVTTGTVIVQ